MPEQERRTPRRLGVGMQFLDYEVPRTSFWRVCLAR